MSDQINENSEGVKESREIFNTLDGGLQKEAYNLANEKGWSLDLAAMAIKHGQIGIETIVNHQIRKRGEDPNKVRQAEIDALVKEYNFAKENRLVLRMVTAKNRLIREYKLHIN